MNVYKKRIMLLLLFLLLVCAGIYLLFQIKGKNADLPRSGNQIPDELPRDWTEQPSPYWVDVAGPGGMIVAPGTAATYTFTIQNIGENPDVYTLTVSTSRGWVDVSGVPTSISLAPGKNRQIRIKVTVPSSAIEGSIDELELTARSQGNLSIFDVVSAQTVVTEDL